MVLILFCHLFFFPGVNILLVRILGGGLWFVPWARKIPWKRKWQPTPVLLPGESHGRKNLVGYSPRGRKESDTTERLHFFTFVLDMELSCVHFFVVV